MLRVCNIIRNNRSSVRSTYISINTHFFFCNCHSNQFISCFSNQFISCFSAFQKPFKMHDTFQSFCLCSSFPLSHLCSIQRKGASAFQGRGQTHWHSWAGSIKLMINEPPPMKCRAPAWGRVWCVPGTGRFHSSSLVCWYLAWTFCPASVLIAWLLWTFTCLN